jgi:glycine/D-amino acid oxidase-like deaminating enzyme
LVHFIDPATRELRDSYMYENKARYVVTRPSPHGREIIVGGTFFEGIGQMLEEDRDRLGSAIVEEAKAEFSDLGLDVSRLRNPREVSVGYRPGRQGEPVIEIGEKVAVVTGFGGQGIVTNPALTKLVAQSVLDMVPRPNLFNGWDAE